ncbi:uncharacterized protein F4807DRAFT_85408 [Annulohypoxylon truncatum]|uniref:uncharacterized protein n=1 Tax=Annulohypoxylon truncatum TaxID=327061 RepID=UPI002008C165|nr:uncharacterized protein F4807DRAFT_85408 [Annulohypoxylon truncatum]KAI1209663.1 hypothetical protein F4807DRAFT_85408 [Annulohypoxylon truncatum]
MQIRSMVYLGTVLFLFSKASLYQATWYEDLGKGMRERMALHRGGFIQPQGGFAKREAPDRLKEAFALGFSCEIDCFNPFSGLDWVFIIPSINEYLPNSRLR